MHVHAGAGHLTVVPLRRVSRDHPPAPSFGWRVRRRLTVIAAFATSRWPRWSSRRRVGSTPISLAPRLRRVDPVGRQRRRADLLRRAAAARAGRRAGRRRAGRGRRGAPGAAAQSAGHAVHARRLGRRARSARCWRSPLGLDLGALGVSSVPLASLAGSMVATGDRLLAGAPSAARAVDEGAAAGRRHAQLVLLGADHVRAVPGRLRAVVPRRALADGRPRRRQLRPDLSRRCRCSSCRLRACSRCCRGRSTCSASATDAAAARGVDVARAAAAGVRQRLAGHRRRRVAGRPDRLHRHRRAASGAADGRRRSPHRAAGVGALRRGVPGRLRPRRAHGRSRRSSCRSASSRR